MEERAERPCHQGHPPPARVDGAVPPESEPAPDSVVAPPSTADSRRAEVCERAAHAQNAEASRQHLAGDLVESLGPRELETLVAFAEFLKSAARGARVRRTTTSTSSRSGKRASQRSPGASVQAQADEEAVMTKRPRPAKARPVRGARSALRGRARGSEALARTSTAPVPSWPPRATNDRVAVRYFAPETGGVGAAASS